MIGYFSSGVTVVTTAAEGKHYGTTTSAVCSVSLEPPTLLICMNKASETGRAVARAGHFAVNILAQDQAAIARHFARKGDDKFADFAVATGKRGAPLLRDVLSTIQCRVVQQESAGTHYVFIAEVETAWASAGSPLAYYRGQFGRLAVDAAGCA